MLNKYNFSKSRIVKQVAQLNASKCIDLPLSKPIKPSELNGFPVYSK
jgi:hypothetical protein